MKVDLLLQEAMPVPNGETPTRGAGGSAADGRFALTMAVMQQLKDVLRDEHCCYEQVCHFAARL